MRLKSTKQYKDQKIEARVSEEEKNKVKRLAMTYCEGDISEWVRYASLNYMPSADELILDKKTPCKKQGAVKRKNKIIRD